VSSTPTEAAFTPQAAPSRVVTGWDFLTGEYPPQPGGVSDYTRRLARALAGKGAAVDVWAPACAGETPVDPGVAVHRLARGFSLRGLAALERGLGPSRDRVLFVQYVPQAFGLRGMNVPFCLWLLRRSRRQRVAVLFHEVAFPRGSRRLALAALAEATRAMARIVIRAAHELYVTIPGWEPLLRELGCEQRPVWLPTSSNVPASVDPEVRRAARERALGGRPGPLVGHFGTYGPPIAALLREVLPPILAAPGRAALLVGRGSDRFAEELRARLPGGRIEATGELPLEQIASHLAACDILVQPFPDGVSSRRGTVMACLAAGLPVVTNDGQLTESMWREGGAVALARSPATLPAEVDALLGHDERRVEIAARGSELYSSRCSLDHLVATLLGRAR
jgi:glycosyltransferase involved in cell wall biosynthesis